MKRSNRGRAESRPKLSLERRRAIKDLRQGTYMLAYVAAEGHLHDTRVSATDGSWGLRPWPPQLVEKGRKAQAQVLACLWTLQDEGLRTATNALLLGCDEIAAAKTDAEADRFQADVVASYWRIEAQLQHLDRQKDYP